MLNYSFVRKSSCLRAMLDSHSLLNVSGTYVCKSRVACRVDYSFTWVMKIILLYEWRCVDRERIVGFPHMRCPTVRICSENFDS